jgi:PadR family transcriptional regulator, regulatory protein PadR
MALKPGDFHVLLALSERPLHGYGIMKDVERESAGEVRLEIGSLYRLLERLLEEGLLEPDAALSDPGDRRRYFKITRLGRRVLKAEAVRLQGLVNLVRTRKLLPERDS